MDWNKYCGLSTKNAVVKRTAEQIEHEKELAHLAAMDVESDIWMYFFGGNFGVTPSRYRR